MRRALLTLVAATLLAPATAGASGWPNRCQHFTCDAPVSGWTTSNWVTVDTPIHHRHHHHHTIPKPEPEDGD